jgi:ABC-type lipoprotein export system ATPase subunit/GNAT superfamily N-acetyltransferase
VSPDDADSTWRFRIDLVFARRLHLHADAGRLAAMFGLRDGEVETLYDGFELAMRPGQIVAVVGPSGAGKSMLLDRVAAQEGGAIVLDDCLARIRRSRRRPSVAMLTGGSLGERLDTLSRCGLAEAAVLAAPGSTLSGGQLFRLALAVALHAARRSPRPSLVVADEFAAALDELTATTLCRQIRKLVAGSRAALLLATPRAELLAPLRPDQVIVKPLGGAPWARRPRRSARSSQPTWRIVRGSMADYGELARFHYIAGPPAAHKRVYVVPAPDRRAVGGPRAAAVLVVSPPLANVRGRNIATGGRYCGSDRSAAMGLLNREMECISRVIVHPIFRGCGLAVRMVKRAIADADTPLVESLAAMGAVHPLFVKAGMTAWPLPLDAHASRLLSAAEAVGLRVGDLPAVAPVRRLLARKRTRAARFLRREIELAASEMFQPGEWSRLTDVVAETCRRAARQYVYYLARCREDTPR